MMKQTNVKNVLQCAWIGNKFTLKNNNKIIKKYCYIIRNYNFLLKIINSVNGKD